MMNKATFFPISVMVLACGWAGGLLLRMRGRLQAGAFEPGRR